VFWWSSSLNSGFRPATPVHRSRRRSPLARFYRGSFRTTQLTGLPPEQTRLVRGGRRETCQREFPPLCNIPCRPTASEIMYPTTCTRGRDIRPSCTIWSRNAAVSWRPVSSQTRAPVPACCPMAGHHAFAIEPHREMGQAAEASLGGKPRFVSVTAEATRLATASVDTVDGRTGPALVRPRAGANRVRPHPAARQPHRRGVERRSPRIHCLPRAVTRPFCWMTAPSIRRWFIKTSAPVR
jgi:hypothetical protein